MIKASYDGECNVLILDFKGNVDGAQAKQVYSDLEKILPEKGKGFSLLADLTSIETMEPEVEGEVKKAMGLFTTHGVSEVLRVVDPDMEIGFNILSRTYYPNTVKVLNFRSREQAEAHLRDDGHSQLKTTAPVSTKTETFVYATYIRTTAEKLWEALTSGDFSVKYWMGFRVEIEQKVGGKLRLLPPKGLERYGDHPGEVLACEPGKKLVYTWNMKDKEPPEVAKKRQSLSRVTYEITPAGPVVRFRLIHENLLPEDIEKDPNTFQGINNGWPAVISSLKSLLETGEAIAYTLPS